MEVGDHGVGHLELVTRQNEEIGRSAKGADDLTLRARSRGALDGTHAGRSNGDDPPAALFCLVDQGGALGADLAPLGVDLVLQRRGFGYRCEGIQADVQRHPGEIHTVRGDLIHEPGREMQPGGRRRG